MVAFIVSLLVTLALAGAVMAYGRRRPVGTPLTWGAAMVASVIVFGLMLLAYGIVPHQWLEWADSELGWRADRFFVGPAGILNAVPIDITYRALRDVVVSGIYGAFLVGHVAMWTMWQNRGRQKPKEIPTSTYGRPLVKKA